MSETPTPQPTAPEARDALLRVRAEVAKSVVGQDAAVTGLLAGVALGVSGVVFQRILANPLASPDFVGVTAGANLFGVAAIVNLLR